MRHNIRQTVLISGLFSVLATMTLFHGTPLKAADAAKTQGASAAAPRDGKNVGRVLAVFEQISQIPRCSKHEERISAWLVEWAKERGFPVKTDDRNNVVVSVPASKGYEHHPTLVLQAHMDMVCQKTDDSTHDFTKDPIVLVRDGDWLRAKDTTLGADDGIGIALALALAEDPDTPHPPLELLVTTDEEVDMTGAEGLSRDFLTGRKYLNIDSETEGSITLGAAGGLKSDLTLSLTFSALVGDQQVFSLRIGGLLGGHSGLEINKNRANANVLVAQALSANIPFRLIDFVGGTAENAITRNSEMILALSVDRVDALKTRLAAFEREIRNQYPDEKNLSITLTGIDRKPDQAASESDSAKAVKLIVDLPQGVHAWSKEFPGLPETSNNVGIVKTEQNTLRVTTFQRSFRPEKLEEITRIIETAASTAGAASSRRSSFPAWPPNANSDLYKKALAAYEQVFKTPLKTEVLHAGLECGYIAAKYPGIEIISIGPTLEKVHTTEERLSVPSLDRVWRFMTELLRES